MYNKNVCYKSRIDEFTTVILHTEDDEKLNVCFMELSTPCCWASEVQKAQKSTHCNIITILTNFVRFLFYIVVTMIIRNQVGTLDKVTIKEIYIAT